MKQILDTYLASQDAIFATIGRLRASVKSLLYEHTCGMIATAVVRAVHDVKTSRLMEAGQVGLKSQSVVPRTAKEDTKFITVFVTCHRNYMVAENVLEKEFGKKNAK